MTLSLTPVTLLYLVSVPQLLPLFPSHPVRDLQLRRHPPPNPRPSKFFPLGTPPILTGSGQGSYHIAPTPTSSSQPVALGPAAAPDYPQIPADSSGPWPSLHVSKWPSQRLARGLEVDREARRWLASPERLDLA